MRQWLDQYLGDALNAFQAFADAQVEADEEAAEMTGIAPIIKTVTVKAPPQKAFDLFTGQMGAWWPKNFTIASSPPVEVITSSGVQTGAGTNAQRMGRKPHGAGC